MLIIYFDLSNRVLPCLNQLATTVSNSESVGKFEFDLIIPINNDHTSIKNYMHTNKIKQ